MEKKLLYDFVAGSMGSKKAMVAIHGWQALFQLRCQLLYQLRVILGNILCFACGRSVIVKFDVAIPMCDEAMGFRADGSSASV